MLVAALLAQRVHAVHDNVPGHENGVHAEKADRNDPDRLVKVIITAFEVVVLELLQQTESVIY